MCVGVSIVCVGVSIVCVGVSTVCEATVIRYTYLQGVLSYGTCKFQHSHNHFTVIFVL